MMKMLEERPLRPLTVPVAASLWHSRSGEAAVAGAIDRARQLLGHVLDGDGQRSPKTRRWKTPEPYWCCCICSGCRNKHPRSPERRSRCAGILDRDQDAIGQPAGRQRPARKIGSCATTCQRGCNHQGRGGAHPKTSLLQNPLPRRKTRSIAAQIARGHGRGVNKLTAVAGATGESQEKPARNRCSPSV